MPGGQCGRGLADPCLTDLSPDRESGCPCPGNRRHLHRHLHHCADIAASAGNPRQIFLNYPLGNPAGRPDDLENQRSVLRAGLSCWKMPIGRG